MVPAGLFSQQVRSDFEKIMESKRDYWTWQRSRQLVIHKVNRKPDHREAYKYYQATFRYTENLRKVLRDLREDIR